MVKSTTKTRKKIEGAVQMSSGIMRCLENLSSHRRNNPNIASAKKSRRISYKADHPTAGA
jgi:hypothetical protein